MKLSFTQIKISITITLLFILVGQGVWIYNMYQAYHEQWASAVEQSIEKAILREGGSRHEQMGGTIAYSPLTTLSDTSRYITKTVYSIDTSFQVRFDRYDPHSQNKFHQFLIKDDLPVDVQQLDSLFRMELLGYAFPLSETQVDYIDLKSKAILASSRKTTERSSKWVSTDLIPIDIFDTIGIQAYAKISSIPILKRMVFQLILSFLLTSICIFLLFKVIKTFFWNERIELMRRESISSITHEFKRPISSAVAQISLIPYYLERQNMDRIAKYAENTLLELNKLTLYTERIQRMSSDVNAKLILNKVLVYLPDFFDRVSERYADIPEKSLDLKIEQKSKLKYLEMDLLHMSNVIDNLIENAIKYSKDDLQITVRVEDVKEGLLIQVKDNGVGISNSEIGFIFDRHFRSSEVGSYAANGFGMGLTYCHLVVKEHGGTILVESELGVGSTFSVWLPVT